jgi:hypothetical protein
MSQVVYTELEGQPLRWEYKGVVPMERRQEASRTPTTWSVSQTNTAQIANTNTGTGRDVYSTNMLAQIFKTPTNAIRTNQIQLYGLKSGSPPNPLYIEIRKISRLQEVEGEETITNITGLVSVTISGTNYYAQTFLASSTKLVKIKFYLASKTGTPDSLIIEVRNTVSGVPASTVISSVSISATELTAGSLNIVTFPEPVPLVEGGTYAIVFRQANNSTAGSYTIRYYTGSNIYGPGAFFSSSNAGTTWTQQNYDIDQLFITYLFYKPTEDVLASGSIAPTSVGTTAGWIAISLSSPIVLRPSETYALVVYTLGGDSANKYVIHSGNSSRPLSEILETSSNSGGAWVGVVNQDLSFQIMGYSMTRIYGGSISNNILTPLGKVLVALIVKAQTSGTMEFAGFDDHTLTSSPVSSTATSQTLITVLASDAPRLRDVAQSTTLNWEIWAAGTGLATAAYTQRQTYYTTNPVYPKDFGFGELYLIADEIPPQGLVVLNDNTAAALYNSSTTATRVDSYELFRVPVRKIEVIQEPTSGRIVMYLIGLP